MSKKGVLKGKRIGVLMGGDSKEREISLKTGNAVLGALRALKYTAIAIDAGKDVARKLMDARIDVAFIAMHGRHGEDGCIQGLCEVMGLPYTGSGVLASALAMDKAAAKRVFASNDVPTPESVLLKGPGYPRMKLPFVVKPTSQGSTIGVSVVRKRADFPRAYKEAKKASAFSGVMAESFIEGRELTVGILDGTALPIIEIRPVEGFYDYKTKYTKGMAEFLVPAKLTGRIAKKVSESALLAYGSLGCAGAARADVMLDNKGNPYVLEVNTVPGMTELSLLPRAAMAAGIGYGELVERMLEGASIGKF